tara:strand:+ start:258 stop:515 length:258 start_codon:yes stop_codon:yes gene_type:complete
MKVLISINDIIYDYEGNQGQRILEIVADDETFPVNPQMTWMDIPDMPIGEVNLYMSTYWYYDNAFSLIPVDPDLIPVDPVDPVLE